MNPPVVFVDLEADGQIIFLVHGVDNPTVDDFTSGAIVYPGPVFGRDAEIAERDELVGRRVHTWDDALHIHQLDPLVTAKPWDGWERRTAEANLWAASDIWANLKV